MRENKLGLALYFRLLVEGGVYWTHLSKDSQSSNISTNESGIDKSISLRIYDVLIYLMVFEEILKEIVINLFLGVGAKTHRISEC
jgi:hypothetical protein